MTDPTVSQHPSLVKTTTKIAEAAWLLAHDVEVRLAPSPDDDTFYYFLYPASAAALLVEYRTDQRVQRFVEAQKELRDRIGGLRRRIRGVAA